jgi:hypothetical protein
MTRDQLHSRTRKELSDLARTKGIAGWHGLRKDELVLALQKALRNEARRSRPGRAPVQRAAERDTSSRPRLAPELPAQELPAAALKDRVVLLVRDPYWLHCTWEVTPQAASRAEAALGQSWHVARPILRLIDVTSDGISGVTERHVRDIPIHGGCNNWYIDVPSPPRSYRVDLGYIAPGGRFYVLGRSNPVTTPRPGACVVDGNWADLDHRKADRLHALSGSHEVRELLEERLRRPLAAPAVISLGTGGLAPLGKSAEFGFEVDADLIVYGRTAPNSRVCLQNQPVTLRPDGSFTVRFPLPDSRQVIRCTAKSPDGGEERMIVLGLERNTRHLDPAPMHEPD